MKIVHRIYWSATETQLTEAMRDAGVDLHPMASGYVTKISEDDSRWPRFKVLAQGRDTATTVFTAHELRESDYVVVSPQWMNGYPEPSDDFGYMRLTYEDSHHCGRCGTGLRQRAPFRLRRPPKWGRRSIFGLHWVYDEYFVPPEVWDAVFKPFGIGCREVVLHKSGVIIENVVQLDVQELVDLDVDDPRLLDVTFELCSACGVKRYNYVSRGYQPRPCSPKLHMFKSTQYFGSGHASDRLVYVSQELYEHIADFRGVEFSACLSHIKTKTNGQSSGGD